MNTSLEKFCKNTTHGSKSLTVPLTFAVLKTPAIQLVFTEAVFVNVHPEE